MCVFALACNLTKLKGVTSKKDRKETIKEMESIDATREHEDHEVPEFMRALVKEALKEDLARHPPTPNPMCPRAPHHGRVTRGHPRKSH